MKTLIKYSLLATVAAAFTACSETDLPGPDAMGDNSLPITLTAAYPTVSRASDAGFEDGDRMGVYVLDYKDGVTPSITGERRADNVGFAFNGSDNSWTSDAPVYWADGKTPADIIAYYPMQNTISDPTVFAHSVSRRQDKEGQNGLMGDYEASDLLWAKAVKAMPTAGRVDLTLSHAMAGVRVTLKQGSGFGQGEWDELDKTVLVANVYTGSTVNLETGAVTVSTASEPVSITPMPVGQDWRAVVVPQTVAAGKSVIALSVGADSYNLVKDTPMTYTQGKMHTFTITVNRREGGSMEFVVTDEAITPWLDDVEFRDGLMRSYITVDVPECGGLEEAVKSAGIEPDKVYNLKLTGKIDQRDYEYMRNEFTYIQALNLNDVETWDGETANRIPQYAISGKKTLTHIIYPAKLTSIGSAAFSSTGLIGDVVIPEGVVNLGDGTGNHEIDMEEGNGWGGAGVFRNCQSLHGKVSLPSTLKYIETCCFLGVGLSGQLVLPDGIQHIGSAAFSGARFSGDLELPQSLTEIGAFAFTGCGFTGDLVIPKGTKRIYGESFTGNFTGNLTLPEGVEQIDGQAFRGCGFKGELKLPSTLRFVASGAFAETKFSNIVFNDGLTSLGADAFANCNRLQGALELPEGITAINLGTFRGCTLLEKVILHDQISKVEGEAFGGCNALTAIVCMAEEPPLINLYDNGQIRKGAFDGIPMTNVTLQVPEQSMDKYRRDKLWSEFRRITPYADFNCRPAAVSALTTAHNEELIIDARQAWTVVSKPDWVRLSATSGAGKAQLTLTVDALSKGSGNRTGDVVFKLNDKEAEIRCTVSQYDYEYGEDECVTLQQATAGRGIDVLFVGDGFDGEAIASGAYMELVQEQIADFFGVEPYKSYRQYFNVYACMSLSQETGINTLSTWRNTRFMTQYYAGSLHPDNADDVFDYAVAHSPLTRERMPQSLIIMAMNSDEYGSATTMTDNGSTISMCPRSTDAYPMDTRGVLQHEACGHGFGKLAEERIVANRYLNKNETNLVRENQDRGWYQNISLTGKLGSVWWNQFIFDPRYSDRVDVYEGAMGVTRGVYRSEINSCMNYGVPYFSLAARLDIVRRILSYAGEEFTMEKFLSLDNDSWGVTESRSLMPDQDAVANGRHRPVRIIRSRKY